MLFRMLMFRHAWPRLSTNHRSSSRQIAPCTTKRLESLVERFTNKEGEPGTEFPRDGHSSGGPRYRIQLVVRTTGKSTNRQITTQWSVPRSSSQNTTNVQPQNSMESPNGSIRIAREPREQGKTKSRKTGSLTPRDRHRDLSQST